jgi:hypothetical protein
MTDREAQQALVEPDVIEPDQEADRDDQLGREQDQQEKEQEGTGPPTVAPREPEARQNPQTDGDDHVERSGLQGDVERVDHPRVLEHCRIPEGRELLSDVEIASAIERIEHDHGNRRVEKDEHNGHPDEERSCRGVASCHRVFSA